VVRIFLLVIKIKQRRSVHVTLNDAKALACLAYTKILHPNIYARALKKLPNVVVEKSGKTLWCN